MIHVYHACVATVSLAPSSVPVLYRQNPCCVHWGAVQCCLDYPLFADVGPYGLAHLHQYIVTLGCLSETGEFTEWALAIVYWWDIFSPFVISKLKYIRESEEWPEWSEWAPWWTWISCCFSYCICKPNYYIFDWRIEVKVLLCIRGKNWPSTMHMVVIGPQSKYYTLFALIRAPTMFRVLYSKKTIYWHR
jgi:hypothetical protein